MKFQTFNRLKRVALCLIFSYFFLHGAHYSKAQNLWGKLYGHDFSYLNNQKGDYSQHADGFIATGNALTSNGTMQAYLMETDMAGSITWQTFLGDTLFNFYGIAVKETSNGNYIVVGKTDKGQTYSGAYNDSCVLTPYYNAFIAYVDPDSSAANWYQVFGDSNLHDEAVEVIEDQNGDFVVTGVASGRLSSDTCSLNDSMLVCPNGFDKTAILFAKFSATGTMLFNLDFNAEYYDQGVSVIEDLSTAQYVLLGNRRNKAQTTFYRPILIQTDFNGTLQNAREYDKNTTADKPPFEFVKYRSDYFIVGQIGDINRNPYSTYYLVVDAMLNNPKYGPISHNQVDLLAKDVLVDNDTLVISGDMDDNHYFDYLNTGSTHQFLTKATVSPQRNPQVVQLTPTSNLTPYFSYHNERNSNFCIYTDTTSVDTTGGDTTQGTPFIGYHLFGTTQGSRLENVKTNRQTQSMCTFNDSIWIDSVLIMSDMLGFLERNLDIYDSLCLITPDIAEDITCLEVILRLTPAELGVFKEQHLSQEFTVYPNPVSDILNVKLPTVTSNCNLFVYALDGSIVYDHKTASETSIVQLNLSSLKTGVYTLTVEESGKTYHQRIIKY